MRSLPRNIYVGLLVALVVFVYMVAGYVVQLAHGGAGNATSVEVLATAFGLAIVAGGIAGFAIAGIAGRMGARPGAKIRLGGIAAVVSGLLVTVAAGLGSMVGADRNAESDKAVAAATAAKEARDRARATEAARIAALNPEQLAAEQRARDLVVENAKKAQAAASAAAAEADRVKTLGLLRQALVVESLKTLRASMKDPDTFELKEVLMMGSGSGCITYRAKNGFGAILQGRAVLSVPAAPKNGGKPQGAIRMYASGQDGFSGAWNKSCANRPGEDLTRTAKRVLDWE